MIKKTIEKILRRNHFWRDVGFDELSELYVSNMLRSVALTIFMVFVPYFMYQQDYSLPAILSMFGLFFIARVFCDIGAAYTVARYGPKHTMIISCILQIISAGFLLTIPQMHWSIFLLGIPWGASASFFFIAYHTAFSKIKHTPKAGAELGHMQIFERLGFAIGPIIGGVIGSVFGPEYIFLAATLLMIGSLWPLFRTSEPIKVHQKLTYRLLPVRKIKRDIVANMCLGLENTLCVNVWPLYVAVFLLSGAVYAQLGAVTAAGVVAAIISARVIGYLSDTSVARSVLRVSAVINGLLYLVRPFVQSIWGVFAVNLANDAATTGYRMPFLKGVYTAADDLPGLRIVYLSSLEATGSIMKATVWFFLAIVATALPFQWVMFVAFAIAGLASFGITSERFTVYNQRS